MKNSTIIVIILFLVMAGAIIYQTSKVSKLETDLAIAHQNIEYANDTLKTFKTEKGVLSKRLVQLTTDFDSTKNHLNKIIDNQIKNIIVKSDIIVKLQKQISEGSGEVTESGDSLYYAFSDSSGFINYYNQVWINKISKLGFHRSEYSADPLPLTVTINQDNSGLFSVTAETTIEEITFSKVEAKVNSDYIAPEIAEVIYKNFWERLGIYGMTNVDGFNTIEGGLIIRPFTIGYQKMESRTFVKVGFNTTFYELYEVIFK